MLLVSAALAQDLVFDGQVPADDDVDYFTVDFDVPAGTAEIEVRHDSLGEDDILDFGLIDPDGFRGWGGGNTEAIVLGAEAASRSYLPGPLPAGRWRLLVGEAQLLSASPSYHVEIDLRDTPTLPAATDRPGYSDVNLGGAGWYQGDLHVHSQDSGDAAPTQEQIATYAESRGLDFVVLTDHNTNAHVDRIPVTQATHPNLLLVPGVEFTTYAGHANAIGALDYVWHTMGWEGHDIPEAAAAFAAQGALFSINHPVLDLGDLCIGCAWENEIPAIGQLGAVEIQTGGYGVTGALFHEDAVAFWEALLDEGHHLAPVGGSDDHRAGEGTGAFDSPIGDPTTVVWMESLSVDGLLQGLANSRTVVKLDGPDGPMIDLETDPPRDGDTVTAAEVTLTATITGGIGSTARFVKNGLPLGEPELVTGDPDTLAIVVTPSAQDRYRVEVQAVDGTPQALSGYVWLEPGKAAAPEGCGCAVTGRPPIVALLLGIVTVRRRRRA